jgi:hypothetical protein
LKTLITGYFFNATGQKVILTDYPQVSLESLLLITNVTNNQIIYNFADPLAGGSVSGNSITLDYNTSGMNNSDCLQIYYDTPYTPATNETLNIMSGQLQALQEQNLLMRRMLKVTESLSIIDTNQRQRVNIDSWGLGGGTTLGNVIPRDAGNTAVNNINGNSFTSSFAAPDVWRTIDIARNTYQNAIRNNLLF